MYGKRKLRANYVSLSSGMRERLLSPLAVVHDGLRWHIRCFDHEAGEYKDYNLARFHTADEEAQSDLRSEEHTSELQSLMRISFVVFCMTKQKYNKNI